MKRPIIPNKQRERDARALREDREERKRLDQERRDECSTLVDEAVKAGERTRNILFTIAVATVFLVTMLGLDTLSRIDAASHGLPLPQRSDPTVTLPGVGTQVSVLDLFPWAGIPAFFLTMLLLSSLNQQYESLRDIVRQGSPSGAQKRLALRSYPLLQPERDDFNNALILLQMIVIVSLPAVSTIETYGLYKVLHDHAHHVPPIDQPDKLLSLTGVGWSIGAIAAALLCCRSLLAINTQLHKLIDPEPKKIQTTP